jgi:hypothetical protein
MVGHLLDVAVKVLILNLAFYKASSSTIFLGYQ